MTTIDYYLAPQSPWTYLGHQRLVDMAKAAGATIRTRPINTAAVFAATGGVQLKDRSPARQAYRLVELARYRDYLNVPLVLEPKFFPVDSTLASKLIIAVQQSKGDPEALKISGAMMTAVWSEERNLADADTLAALLQECDLPAECLAQAASADVQSIYENNTQEAIERGVFGAPTYVINGENFWGQDRLLFVALALKESGSGISV